MHVTPAFSFFAGEEAWTRRSSSSRSSSSSRPRIAAPADRFNASAVLAAGGGIARLLAEAGSCLASSFAGAEAEAIGQSYYCVDPGGKRHRHVKSPDVCLSLCLFRAHITKYCKKIQKIQKQNTMVRHSRKSTRDRGPTTDQRINTNDYMFGPVSFCR